MASATSATRVMLPKAVTKSLQTNSRCNLPLATLQPFVFGSRACTSASVSFFAGMAGTSKNGRHHYAAQGVRQQECCRRRKGGGMDGRMGVEWRCEFH